MTILVVGATGTLGRQIVRELLNSGYQVNCLVRNVRKANFLQEWGAKLLYSDLSIPETIPPTLKGINTIIDAATLRPEEELTTLQEIDLIGKIALIKAAKIAKIKKFFFISLNKNKEFQTIPLMKLKRKLELTIEESNIPYIVFQISGFYQGLIGQYAIPILEKQTIFTAIDSNLIGYLDTQDIAKIFTKTLIKDKIFEKQFKNKTFQLTGPRDWNSKEIISLCEEISGQKAKIQFIPFGTLNSFKILSSLFKWTWSIHDRLAFSETLLLNNSENLEQIDALLDIKKENLNSLENYLQDYFENIIIKLRNLNYDQEKRKDLIF